MLDEMRLLRAMNKKKPKKCTQKLLLIDRENEDNKRTATRRPKDFSYCICSLISSYFEKILDFIKLKCDQIYCSPPTCFDVELTNYCNLNCAICPHSLMKRKKGFMDINTFKKIVDQSKKYKFPIHWLQGVGEPLMHPDLESILRYFHENGLGLGGISTNCLLLDERRMNIIVKYCKIVRLSIDSTNPGVYQHLRRNKKHKEACEKINMLINLSKDSNLKIEIQLLRTRLNRDEGVKEFQKIFGTHKNVKYIIKNAVLCGNAEDFRVNSIKSDVRKCLMPYNHLNIAWNGDATFCCFDCEINQRIGNIKMDSLNRIWRGAKTNELRKQLRKGEFDMLPVCKKCSGPI